jgi:hypothetical protein
VALRNAFRVFFDAVIPGGAPCCSSVLFSVPFHCHCFSILLLELSFSSFHALFSLFPLAPSIPGIVGSGRGHLPRPVLPWIRLLVVSEVPAVQMRRRWLYSWCLELDSSASLAPRRWLLCGAPPFASRRPDIAVKVFLVALSITPLSSMPRSPGTRLCVFSTFRSGSIPYLGS